MCSGLPLPSLRHLSDPGIEATSSVSLALAGRFFTTVRPGKTSFQFGVIINKAAMHTQIQVFSGHTLLFALGE